jgi:hypothetical protein
MKTITKLWIAVLVLAVMTPAGFVLPELFKSGPAWGEWSADELGKLIGYVPGHLARLSLMWRAPVPGYVLNVWPGSHFARMSIGYILSAMVGVVAIFGIFYLIVRSLYKK